MQLQLVQFYNHTKGGVNTIDKMRGQYSTARISRYWPLAVFFAMLAGYWRNKRDSIVSAEQRRRSYRDTYLRNLAHSLLMEHVQCHLTIDQTLVEI